MSIRTGVFVVIFLLPLLVGANTVLDQEISRLPTTNPSVLGAWVAKKPNALWTFTSEGYLVISFRDGGAIGALLSYKATSNSIEVLDLSSPKDVNDTNCASINTGSYSYEISQNVMTLKRINDPCEPRRSRINGLELINEIQFQ